MLTVIQHASLASKVLAFRSTLPASGAGPEPKPEAKPETSGGFANRQLSVDTLFYLATLGGARVCDIDKHVGSFEPGKSFDALVVSVRPETGNPLIWNDDVGRDEGEGEDIKDLLARWLERFLFGGDDRNILRVYVQGRLIGGKSFQVHR
jgi:guanine deaminase